MGYGGGISGSWMRPHAPPSLNNKCLWLTLCVPGRCCLSSFFLQSWRWLLLYGPACCDVEAELPVEKGWSVSHSCMFVMVNCGNQLNLEKNTVQNSQLCTVEISDLQNWWHTPQALHLMASCALWFSFFFFPSSNLLCCLAHKSACLSKSNLNIPMIAQAFLKTQLYWFWQRVNQ